MRFASKILQHIAVKLGIPAEAVAMFRSANALSGFDKSTLPTELIPLNTIQLSRGLLNFAVMQSSLSWVLPYWVQRQYDRHSPSFVPRSHLGLSMNVTHRNWTAIGNPDCPVEPIVDPRGMVTPLKDGWSIDVWLGEGDACLFPSRLVSIRQRLIHDLPIVETSFSWRELQIVLLSYSKGPVLSLDVSIHNPGTSNRGIRVAFAIRPFNPEGVALIHELRFDDGDRAFRVGSSECVSFSRTPQEVHCRSFREGDAAESFRAARGTEKRSANCEIGLANGYAAFLLDVGPESAEEVSAFMKLSNTLESADIRPTPGQAIERWEDILTTGVVLKTPDPDLDALFRASLATLIMLLDGNVITPGPATYHQFWFRDAAYMLSALDRAGFAHLVAPVISSWPQWQDREGFFRSQQGEWDANGQVLWEVWHHLQYDPSGDFLDGMFPSLRNAAKWITRMRRAGENVADRESDGLLPPGLSAEHLGLVDRYYWDNFWSLSGLQAYERLCLFKGLTPEKNSLHAECAAYCGDIERSIAEAQKKCSGLEIPAGPHRSIDAGMIGSCSAWYPLQLLPDDDPSMIATLHRLEGSYSQDGLFFQDFIHSGFNTYLSLQIAHAWLYGHDRGRFWNIVQRVMQAATPTLTFPEAIHPITGGGVMGDGHHGWAAAEIVSALCDAFAYPRWGRVGDEPLVEFLGGIPPHWFAPGEEWTVRNLPGPGGTVGMACSASQLDIHINFDFCQRGTQPPGNWLVRLPLHAREILLDGKPLDAVRHGDADTCIHIPPAPAKLIVVRT
jgi:hypothetical protein